MNEYKIKFETLKHRIKIFLKIKKVYSFIMSKVSIFMRFMTIKSAIEEAWKVNKLKRM